jgi:hypothetical protein
MKCKWCEGTGERHYERVERHADGSRTERRVYYTCEWCRGEGERKSIAEIIGEVEADRAEQLGAKGE